jgi:dihydropteroate synthase
MSNTRILVPGRATVMGIITIAPQAGANPRGAVAPTTAIDRGRALAAQGADVLDVAGASTRPGAPPVAVAVERRRVVRVIEALTAQTDAVISVTTANASVAGAAIDAGARMVTDPSAFRADPAMAGLVADRGVSCCVMHRANAARAAGAARNLDVVGEVKAALEERIEVAIDAGVAEERILLDPGLGFGRRLRETLELLARVDEIAALGRPVVVGTARKHFVGQLTGRPVDERCAGSVASSVVAFLRGASAFRVHDVGAVVDALAVARAVVGRATNGSAAARERVAGLVHA